MGFFRTDTGVAFAYSGAVSPSIFQSAGNYQWAMWYPDIYAATPATMWTVAQNEIAKKRRHRLVLT